MNTLYYGDNLDILRHHVKDETVDLVYLDPPFKSNQDYNVLFQEQDGARAAAQILAFEDTWRWDMAAEAAYRETVEAGGRVSEALQAFRMFLGENDMMSYLAMMAPRLVELRRVLKSTGSIYLHCDAVASAHLRMLMDAVFSQSCFRSEVIWKRTSAHSGAKRYGTVDDRLLFYTKSQDYTWNPPYQSYDEQYLKSHYPYTDEDGRRYGLDNITGMGSGAARVFGGEIIEPPPGRHWMWTQERIDSMIEQGRILFTKQGKPRYKRCADESPGVVAQTVWTDIFPINSQAAERLGYPTQKPEALLERVVNASSNLGDLILDPFSGCGTAIAVAQRLNRRWIGIDITHLAIAMIKHRMHHAFGDSADYRVIGEPVSLPDAQTLATQDPFQFQCWAVSLVAGRPVESKKGADKGIDGKLFFIDDPEGKKTQQIILSVKAGHTNVAHVRDLRGVADREKAAIGALISMQEPTQPMRIEAASAGFYDSAIDWGRRFPQIQLLTIRELLDGKRIDMPPQQQVNQTFRKARRLKDEAPEQLTLE